jgi:hypothetical protein
VILRDDETAGKLLLLLMAEGAIVLLTFVGALGWALVHVVLSAREHP